MNSKCNGSTNTRVRIANIVEKEKAIANIRDLFRGTSRKLSFSAFTAMKDLYLLRIFHKEPLQRNYKVYTKLEYTTLTLNLLHKR